LFYFYFFFCLTEIYSLALFRAVLVGCVCVCALCVHVLDACSTDFSPDVLSYFLVVGWVGFALCSVHNRICVFVPCCVSQPLWKSYSTGIDDDDRPRRKPTQQHTTTQKKNGWGFCVFCAGFSKKIRKRKKKGFFDLCWGCRSVCNQFPGKRKKRLLRER
jgi:hypothetical protein